MRELTRVILLSAFAVILPLAAQAADLPAYKAPVPAICTNCGWSGFYVGASVGAVQDLSVTTDTWTWTTNYPVGTLLGIGGAPLFTTTTPITLVNPFADASQHSGFGIIGGPQVGYNWQVGHVVFGIEGDWSWSSVKNSSTYLASATTAVFPPLPNFFFSPNAQQGWTTTERLQWLSTLRARLGWASSSSLWYLTGGAALGRINTSYALTSTPGNSGLTAAAGPLGPGTFGQFGLPGGVAAANFSQTRLGWSLGGGVETKLGEWFGPSASRWSMKFEYLFADLGHFTDTFTAPLVAVCASSCATPVTGSTTFTSDRQVYEQMLRLGLNYKL